MRVGDFIKSIREKRGLTQLQLSELLFVDVSLVCRWEKGERRVTTDDFLTILDVLNITLEEFNELRGVKQL